MNKNIKELFTYTYNYDVIALESKSYYYSDGEYISVETENDVILQSELNTLWLNDDDSLFMLFETNATECEEIFRESVLQILEMRQKSLSYDLSRVENGLKDVPLLMVLSKQKLKESGYYENRR